MPGMIDRRSPFVVFVLAFTVTAAAQQVQQRDAADPRAGEAIIAGHAATNPLGGAPPISMPGWPIMLPVHPTVNFAPTRGLAFADLDRDGRMEIIRSNTDSLVYVFRLDGTAFPGWPVPTTGFGQIVPTVADLDGDGTPEIVVPTRGLTNGGRLYVFRTNGTLFPGWPLDLGNNNVESATAADLDGDGDLELIAAERRGSIGVVHVFQHNGTAFGGTWPLTLDHVPTGTAAVGDLDADGTLEVVLQSYNSLFVTDANGALRPGFPIDFAQTQTANFSYQSPALGDLDGDGTLEIVVACHRNGSACHVLRHDGSLLPGWPKSFGGTWSYCPPTLADLDGDGRLDVLCGRAGGTVSAPALYAWRANGSLLPGFPVAHPGGAEAPLTVGDIDQDGQLEILYDSNVMANGFSQVRCVDSSGRNEPGFPVLVRAFPYMNGATIGDVDGNGSLEIGVVTYLFDNLQRFVEVHLWTIAANPPAGRIAWKGYHEGNERRGLAAESDRFAVTGEAARGGVVLLELQGTAGNQFVVLLGFSTALRPLPPYGVLRLGAPVQQLFAIGLPANGRLQVPLPIPASAVLLGLPLDLQGAEADLVANTIALRQMVPLTVR